MEETIKTLPKKERSFVKGQIFHTFQGHWYPEYILKDIILAQDNFKAQPSDIFLCSSVKTGTTWLKALAFAIVTRKNYDEATNPLLTTFVHECLPVLEMELSKVQNNQKNKDVPLVATHLPYASLPSSIIASNCKIVYIYRNTKDVCVSYYHFVRELHNLSQEEASFENAFEEYFGGFSIYGPYWDHVLGYWKASIERPERILLLKYEDLQRDPSSNVKRLAKFLGYPFSPQEEESGMVEKTIKLCSFKNLRNLEVNKSGQFCIKEKVAIEKQVFFRKGETGDWENYFTEEMKEKLDKIMDEKLSGTGLILTE